jgi:predicted MFS family arabinose efflux permease
VALGNAVAAAAPSLGVLIGARALVGAAAGGLVPGALVLLADEHSGPSQARKQAALVGLAGNANGWRAVFALTAGLSVVLDSAARLVVTDHPKRSSRAEVDSVRAGESRPSACLRDMEQLRMALDELLLVGRTLAERPSASLSWPV